MRHTLRSAVVLFTLLAGCGSEPRRPVTGPAEATVPVEAVRPTERTEAQKRRDAEAAPRVNAILDAFENSGPVISPDGKHLLFRSNRGGVVELYLSEVARPESAPRKLASGPDRISSGQFTRDGRAVLYRQDRGADENFHIYRVGLDGAGAVDLTPHPPLWRDHPLLPRARPDIMVYSARKPTDYTSMIYVQPLAGGAARLVYTEKGPATAVDVSADGARALFVREARGGHQLLEVDLVGGTGRQLWPPQGQEADVSAAAYAVDGKRVYVATDTGPETNSLFAFDLATMKVQAEHKLLAPTTASVRAVVPSPRGDRIAVELGFGDHSTIAFLDATSLVTSTPVRTPLGTAGLGARPETGYALDAGSFTQDGRQLVIELSIPNAPDDVYLVEVATGALTPLRREPRAGLESLKPIVTTIEQVVGFDGLRIPVNLYLPAKREPGRKLPTLVYFHGGPDQSSTVSWGTFTQVFMSFGYAVAEPNIRGSRGFGRAFEQADNQDRRVDSMRDLESVNRWLRAQVFCDPDRIIVYGASYGGYLVLMALTRQPTLWSAGIDLAGPSDLTTFLTGGIPTRYLDEFGDPGKNRERNLSLSPMRDVDKIVAPLFVYQGDNDMRVRRDQADAIVGALRKRGRPVEYMVAPDEGHTVARRHNRVEFLTRAMRFLDEQLARRR